MANKKKKKTSNGRDYLMVAIINGATKSSVFKDKKKELDKNKCRKALKNDD